MFPGQAWESQVTTVVAFVRAPDRLSNTVEQDVCCDQCALNKIRLMAPLLLTAQAVGGVCFIWEQAAIEGKSKGWRSGKFRYLERGGRY